MNTKKSHAFSQITLIIFSCLIVPIILGVGYAAWIDKLEIETFIETGFIDAEFKTGGVSKTSNVSLEVGEEYIVFEDLLSEINNRSLIPTDEDIEYDYNKDAFDVNEDDEEILILTPTVPGEFEVSATIIIGCGVWEEELTYVKNITVSEPEPQISLEE